MSPPQEKVSPVLRLYIAGQSQFSQRAYWNLKEINDEHFEGRCQIEVIDVLEKPEKALADGILVTPTLIKLSPGSRVRIIGDLSAVDKVLFSLGADRGYGPTTGATISWWTRDGRAGD